MDFHRLVVGRNGIPPANHNIYCHVIPKGPSTKWMCLVAWFVFSFNAGSWFAPMTMHLFQIDIPLTLPGHHNYLILHSSQNTFFKILGNSACYLAQTKSMHWMFAVTYFKTGCSFTNIKKQMKHNILSKIIATSTLLLVEERRNIGMAFPQVDVLITFSTSSRRKCMILSNNFIQRFITLW